MAKKESKKEQKKAEKAAKAKKGAAGNSAPGYPSTGVPPTGTPSTGVPPTGTPSVPLSAMMPDQMTAQQLEQAIKESNDPESRLKKLHSPISVKSCLLNILFLIIMTLAIVIIWCAIAVDKFNFVRVVTDMSDKFGITSGFQWLWAQISGWFGGGGG